MEGTVLPDTQRSWQAEFPAALTARTQDSDGTFRYTFTEKIVDGATGDYADAVPGRSGTEAVERNNLWADVSDVPVVMMRLRGSDEDGDALWEFPGRDLVRWTLLGTADSGIPAASGLTPGADYVTVWAALADGTMAPTTERLTGLNPDVNAVAAGTWVELFLDGDSRKPGRSPKYWVDPQCCGGGPPPCLNCTAFPDSVTVTLSGFTYPYWPDLTSSGGLAVTNGTYCLPLLSSGTLVSHYGYNGTGGSPATPVINLFVGCSGGTLMYWASVGHYFNIFAGASYQLALPDRDCCASRTLAMTVGSSGSAATIAIAPGCGTSCGSGSGSGGSGGGVCCPDNLPATLHVTLSTSSTSCGPVFNGTYLLTYNGSQWSYSAGGASGDVYVTLQCSGDGQYAVTAGCVGGGSFITNYTGNCSLPQTLTGSGAFSGCCTDALAAFDVTVAS